MRKKMIAALLLAAMAVTLLGGCGKKGRAADREMVVEIETEESEKLSPEEELAAEIVGTWAADGVIIDGSYYSLAEAESMGEYSLSNSYILFKDGGSCYVTDDGSGQTFTWSVAEGAGSIIIGEAELPWDESTKQLTLVDSSGTQMLLSKFSDSQDITQIPAVKESESEEAAAKASEEAEQKAAEEAAAKASEEAEKKAAEEAAAKASEEAEKKAAEEKKASTTVSKEFKEMMDAYEDFFDEYVDFIKKYNSSSNQMSMMSDYLDMLTRYTETMEEIEDIENEDLSDADMAYYLDTMTRIEKKLLEAY